MVWVTSRADSLDYNEVLQDSVWDGAHTADLKESNFLHEGSEPPGLEVGYSWPKDHPKHEAWNEVGRDLHNSARNATSEEQRNEYTRLGNEAYKMRDIHLKHSSTPENSGPKRNLSPQQFNYDTGME